MPVNSFRSKETDLLRYVSNINLVNISKLPNSQEIYDFYSGYGLIEQKLEYIMNFYQQKKVIMDYLQQGIDINSLYKLKISNEQTLDQIIRNSKNASNLDEKNFNDMGR
jgi:hypothetical protein